MADMPSQKLTVDFRDRLSTALLAHRFDGEKNALRKRESAHAEAVYADIYGADIKKMAGLPRGWLPEKSQLGVRFGTSYTEVRFGGERRVWSRHVSNAAKVYEAVDRLAVEFHDIEAAKKDLRTRRDAAAGQIRAALSKFGTTKQLLEGWPEVESFVRQIIGKPRHSLPAVPVASLNALLDLPPDEQAAA